jgi:hypothetical protein
MTDSEVFSSFLPSFLPSFADSRAPRCNSSTSSSGDPEDNPEKGDVANLVRQFNFVSEVLNFCMLRASLLLNLDVLGESISCVKLDLGFSRS